MTYANRGMDFEDLINFVNELYLKKGIAFIEKKPTPMKVLRMKPRPKGHFHGCFLERSSVDYSGISHGRSIYFEAKTTKHRTRFPLDNIKEHQTETLKIVKRQGGIAFFLIEFSKLKEVYILSIEQATKWLDEAENGGRKSIPYSWFVENCELVKNHKEIPLHYLACLGVLA